MAHWRAVGRDLVIGSQTSNPRTGTMFGAGGIVVTSRTSKKQKPMYIASAWCGKRTGIKEYTGKPEVAQKWVITWVTKQVCSYVPKYGFPCSMEYPNPNMICDKCLPWWRAWRKI